MPSLDAITFDTVGMTPQASDSTRRRWVTSDGDEIELTGQDEPPQYCIDPKGLQRYRDELAEAATRQSAGLVELDLLSVHGCPALLSILKMVQEPSGRLYIGSLELLFRDFSYRVRVVSHELGTTGVRETVLVHRFFESGHIQFTTAGLDRAKAGEVLGPETMEGWLVDWLSTPVPAHLARTIGEDRRFDAEFSTHPLSRSRRILSHVQRTMSLHDDVLRAAPYVGRPRSWWCRITRPFGAA
jgi:hypothetical protein